VSRNATPAVNRSARLQQATSAAATTLLKMMVDPTTPVSVRVRADDSIFNHAAKGIEIEDVEARLARWNKPLQMEDSDK